MSDYDAAMKGWLLALALAACSSSDPHKVVACQGYLDQTGSAFTGTCEAACQKAGSNGSAPTGKGGTCTGLHKDGEPTITCGMTFDFDGTPGCCSVGTDGVADVEFFACL